MVISTHRQKRLRKTVNYNNEAAIEAVIWLTSLLLIVLLIDRRLTTTFMQKVNLKAST